MRQPCKEVSGEPVTHEPEVGIAVDVGGVVVMFGVEVEGVVVTVGTAVSVAGSGGCDFFVFVG